MTHSIKNRSSHVVLSLLWLAASGGCGGQAGARTETAAATTHFVAPAAASSRGDAPSAEEVLQRPDLGAYRGWIKYLQFQVEHAAERHPGDAGAETTAQRRLAEWTQRILQDPSFLRQVRGTFEWAHESRADGSGQPFKLSVPLDYDATKPAPLVVYLHGYMGDHLAHATDIVDHDGPFEISVLGRSRGAAFRALGEADVLEVLDYVSAHWAIDLDRVHLRGGSMGGHGALLLGARHPDRFASLRSACGWASDLPLANLIHLPIFATHSDDDPIVPVLQSRGPLQRLLGLGGQLVYDETTGYGHEVWNYEAGNQRGKAWSENKRRADSRQIREIDYTALDGGAAHAWWAEVAEWGPRPEPARLKLSAREGNVLEASLDNVASLRLLVSKSPFDARAPLRIVGPAGGFTVAPPLPDTLLLTSGGQGWAAANSVEPSFRLHTPGGANRLYGGEPVLIIYGTKGGVATTASLHRAADAASRSVNAAWTLPTGPSGSDGVPYQHSLYSQLPVKADTEVTDSDLRAHHLVLIGSASQNYVVARFADQLPVSLSVRSIRYSDGLEVSSTNTALGLVYYSPVDPSRLLYWLASEEPGAYASLSAVSQVMEAPTGLDSIILRNSDSSLVLGRSFDSRWNWLERNASPLLPTNIVTTRSLNRWIASFVRKATDADFAVSTDLGFEFKANRWPSEDIAQSPGNTRLSDVLGFFYYDPIGVMSLTGGELVEAEHALTKPGDAEFEPPIDRSHIDVQRSYTVALTTDQVWTFGRRTHLRPRSYRETDLTASQVVARFGGSADQQASISASNHSSTDRRARGH